MIYTTNIKLRRKTVEKYFYPLKEGLYCTQICKVNPQGVMIGSHKCKKSCDHCRGFNDEESWIKCDVLESATQN